jgi:integrase
MHDSQARRVRVERGVYVQPNGKYAVCFMVAGKPPFRTVGTDLGEARAARAALIEAAVRGEVPVGPSLRFGTVVGLWFARFEQLATAGLRRERTLEAHRYYLDRHLLPRLTTRKVSAITVEDVSELIPYMRTAGASEKTTANAVATLRSVLRFALRQGWIVNDPVARLERGERPRPTPRSQRVLGRGEVSALLASCAEQYRPLVATALFTGMRISELLGLVWEDVDLDAGVIHVRARLSRARRGSLSKRVAPKTRAAVRDVPLVPQLRDVLRAHRPDVGAAGREAWVFPSRAGTPLGHRNAQRRALSQAAARAGLEDGTWPALRFHDLRHTFASHLIVDLRLDVAQVSRILGHAQITTTLNVYTHLFDDARHADELKDQMAASAFARLLDTPVVGSRASGVAVGHLTRT